MKQGIAAGRLWEFRGEEICLDLETSAEGEDLLTGQTALAGVQKSYTKNSLERYILLFGVWTRVWHSAFTDRCRSLLERRGDGQTPASFSKKKGASGAD
ncbi:protein FAM110B isoform X2 [Camarhynchus parvulus]|uniref:protein FAM110B isoform X2 n=1 Tax=Geospiza parvula TaxID=87175 RepID=UPI001237C59E|nr:protein FAM110B isoform X2 [Camarhynchus parvulus]